ncbi:hypothetical protein CSPB12327_06155 [Campylobacter sp. RM12327]|uniref:hypothetical protein n=1 Tax=Campylobacter sputorum TaxID=206 RepID=UPI00125FC6BD|nr:MULTISPECIES: hypothetical protein [Campylobacter]MBE7357854.1 hypothetical protein [Campylobacter sp. RM11302]MBF6669719.1 hypothetical protein [Campylobacter sp. RM12327]MBF6674862.1 hypothetical protein [Campylobacter sp. RM13538]MBF6675700.1 hypothetical protein [Campylobacter sp. RM12321]MBF6677508.1 hypothetical protein [Campylobacter sp. RM11259]
MHKNYFYERYSESFRKEVELLSKFDDFKDINADFTRLFIANLDETKASPFASFTTQQIATNLYSKFSRNSSNL